MIKLGGDSSRDKDKKKSARELVKSSEEKYRTLLENLPQKIFLKDRKSVYLACNENYARDLAIDADDIAGKTDDDFFPKKLAEKYKTDDRRVMREGRTEDIEEEYLVEGEKRLVHSVKTPVRDRQGDVIGILGIFWDITGQKKVEKELQSAYHELKRRRSSLSSRPRWRPWVSLQGAWPMK